MKRMIMLNQVFKIFLFTVFTGYVSDTRTEIYQKSFHAFPVFHSGMLLIRDIPLPAGFIRVPLVFNSFADYLRKLPLRKDKTIYLFNKQPKANQSLHYAVVDISTGNKDLQQCADAIMRLRAECFYDKKLYDSIRFPKDAHSFYQFSLYLQPGCANTRQAFMNFMEQIFINCGTYTLQQQLKPVSNFCEMQIGDVFVKGGAPGHAEIIVDMAVNIQTREKIYLLAEGYMPAQDIHILLNPGNRNLGPWYAADSQKQVITASWVFTTDQLRHW